MTSHLLEEALKHVPSPQALVNAVSKRVKQLSQGDRPLVDAGIRAGFADIAFMEIAEGKLTLEMPPEEVMPVA
jgi:DNA-directed RNA polymerase subunit omega